jgi:hypothetical protein
MAKRRARYNFKDGSNILSCLDPLNQSLDLSADYPRKSVDEDLQNILLDIGDHKPLIISSDKIDKIFLGFGGQPNEKLRHPVWLPPSFISSHILIGGSIGSGKTSLTYRLIAGALNTYGTVVIGEAKGGLRGYPQGAAFTNLAKYLEQRLSIKQYRWPRGNCWFNPLLYLNKKEDRKNFMVTVSEQIETGPGELQAYVRRAADIASNVLECLLVTSLSEEAKIHNCTLRRLVNFLKNPEQLEKEIISQLEKIQELGKNSQYQNFAEYLHQQVEAIKTELTRLSFFALKDDKGRDKFVMTASGLNLFIDQIDNEDLFYYTENRTQGRDNQPLTQLKLDDILYQRALVVISQPLNDQHSKVTGPFFWDALLDCVLDLGPNPLQSNGKSRQKVAVFLDETHRLPVGQLGNSGDFLRQYNIGLIEITPAVVDKERWERNKHVYQTIISMSPGVDEVVILIHNRLPNQEQEILKISDETTEEGYSKPFLKINDPILGKNNPGVSIRSLRKTGRYTALLHSEKINNADGCFWIDLESSLLERFDDLLQEALDGSTVAAKLVDYTLGLVKEYS